MTKKVTSHNWSVIELERIQTYLEFLKLNKEQIEKVNKLRLLIGNEAIK